MDRRTMLILGAAAVPTGASAWGLVPAPAAPSTAVKIFAIYDRPDDPDAFFTHYEQVHAPLVKKTPGLQSFVLNRVTEEVFGGEPRYVLIAEMTYADRTAFEAAMKSPENQAVGQDLMSFAKGKVRIVVADSAAA